MMIDTAGAAGPAVVMELRFRAPRAAVFRAWTEPELIKKWHFADAAWETHLAETDLRELGAFRIGIRPRTREWESVIHGRFVEVVPGERLAYTWRGALERADYWTLVRVRFADDGEGSRLELTHGVFADEQDRMAHEQGWIGCLTQLGRLLGE